MRPRWRNKSLVSFLKSEIVLSKRITDFPWLIIAGYNQTPRHWCLSFGMNYLRGGNCWGVRYCIHSNRISDLAYWVIVIIIVRDLERWCNRQCWDRFFKSLVNLTHRGVSYRAGLIRRRRSWSIRRRVSFLCDFCDDWLVFWKDSAAFSHCLDLDHLILQRP